jgi:beta-glucanase (GH16 family)
VRDSEEIMGMLRRSSSPQISRRMRRFSSFGIGLGLLLAAASAQGQGTYFYDDWSTCQLGGGPDAAWGVENLQDPNNGNVHYTNVTPSQSSASNPSTMQVISDPTSPTGRALQITIQKDPNFTTNHDYDSAEISTKLSTVGGNNCEYGTVEALIKVPGSSDTVGSRSIWPAFWMLGDNISQVGWPKCGEIDIMETVGWLENKKNNGSLESQNDGTLHGPAPNGQGIMDYNGGNGVGGTTILPNNELMYTGYHLYAVSWSPSSITWSVDGVPYNTETPATANFASTGGTWVFNNHPFYMILNVNAGGAFGGSTVLNDTLNMDVAYVSYNSYAYSGTASGGGNQPANDVSDANTSANAQDAAIVPEPGTLSLLGGGLIGLTGYGWRKRKVRTPRSSVPSPACCTQRDGRGLG